MVVCLTRIGRIAGENIYDSRNCGGVSDDRMTPGIIVSTTVEIVVVCLTGKLQGGQYGIYDSRNCGGVSDQARLRRRILIYDSRNCGGVSDSSAGPPGRANLRQ